MKNFFTAILNALASPHLWTDVALVLTLIAPTLHEPWKAVVASILGVISFYFHTQL